MRADQVTFPPYTLFYKHSSWFGRCTKFVLRPCSNSLHFCLPFVTQTACAGVTPASTCFYNTGLYRLKPFLCLHKNQLGAYTVWAEASGEPKNRTAPCTYRRSPFLAGTSGRSTKRISVQRRWEVDAVRAFTPSAANTAMAWSARAADLLLCSYPLPHFLVTKQRKIFETDSAQEGSRTTLHSLEGKVTEAVCTSSSLTWPSILP